VSVAETYGSSLILSYFLEYKASLNAEGKLYTMKINVAIYRNNASTVDSDFQLQCWGSLQLVVNLGKGVECKRMKARLGEWAVGETSMGWRKTQRRPVMA
jgi:hypothetical protein